MKLKNEQLFRFEAYRTLRKKLGEYDAIVELNELAVRKFLHDIEGSEEIEINEASRAYGIKVNVDRNIDHQEFTARRAQFYILSVYQQSEQFFDDLMNDLPLGYKWKTTVGYARGKEEAQLEWIMRMIKENTEVKPTAEFKNFLTIFNYFRLVRNAFMHEGTETRELKRSLDKIRKLIAEIEEEQLDECIVPVPVDEQSATKNGRKLKVIAPSAYGQMQFADFLYFTRVVKEIAEALCIMLKPDLDSLLKHTFSKEKSYGLRQYLANPERFASACATQLIRKFNLAPDEIQYSVPIIRSLI